MKNLEQTVKVLKIIDGFSFKAFELPYTIKLAGVTPTKITSLGMNQAHILLKSLISPGKVKITEKTDVKTGQVEADVKIGEYSVNKRMNKFLINNGFK